MTDVHVRACSKAVDVSKTIPIEVSIIRYSNLPHNPDAATLTKTSPDLTVGISFCIKSIEPCFCQLAARKVEGVEFGTTMVDERVFKEPDIKAGSLYKRGRRRVVSQSPA
jgi:hypothetical protein